MIKVKQQRGIALISVMLIVALCVVLASQLLKTQRLGISRAHNMFERQQAFQYAKGSESFVKMLLTETLKEDNGVTHLEQTWAAEGMAFPVSNGLIEGRIIDLHSCFNLNGLWKPNLDKAKQKALRDMFVRLLESLEVESEVSLEDLANNVYDWIDPDDYATEAGGYDGDMYSSMEFPYLSGNSALAHENELRVIYGFDPLTLNKIKKFVCVIPQYHELMINVNTVKENEPEVLMAVLNIDESTAQKVIGDRPEKGFQDINEFWDLPSVKAISGIANVDRKAFTVSSKFFKLITNATYNDAKFALTSLIQLDEQYRAWIIGRRFGGEVERKANPEDEQPKS
ncbi:type II secretion system minor pseudopilin GspK [Psychrosphaera haliotis]|uniref:Type II secretion system protein K n=1 Tax=Psychrosphaera haliotis TaxID=555083 RepID=A0A6N8FAT5_9GAMM|nr:type II secretion system minor pseudopilin GspK [Psychrosphaera haliotis]MUH73428.1 general secretion pathway protein GspK [Psychrosphaera haliotis]